MAYTLRLRYSVKNFSKSAGARRGGFKKTTGYDPSHPAVSQLHEPLNQSKKQVMGVLGCYNAKKNCAFS